MSSGTDRPSSVAPPAHTGTQAQPTRNIRVLGVPLDMGASRRGVDMGPSAVRVAGLKARLEALGHTVVDAGNASVVEQKILEGTLRRSQELGESGRSEIAGIGIQAQPGESGAGIFRFPGLNPAEMAWVGKTENAVIQFEANIDMDA